MTFSGAWAKFSSNQTAQDFTTPTMLAWDAQDYNVGGWHSLVTDPSRMTVPAGVNKVVVYGCAYIESVAAGGNFRVEIVKNGTTVVAKESDGAVTATVIGYAMRTRPLDVVAGDYFELRVTTAGDTSVTLRADITYLAIEKYPQDSLAAFSGAMAHKSVDQTGANYTTTTILTWDAERYDVGGWHSNVTQNTRMTVPAGVSYVRLIGYAKASSVTVGQFSMVHFRKNGDTSRHYGLCKRGSGNITVHHRLVHSPPIPVSPGDYFEMLLQVTGDTSITVETESYFAIEKAA